MIQTRIWMSPKSITLCEPQTMGHVHHTSPSLENTQRREFQSESYHSTLLLVKDQLEENLYEHWNDRGVLKVEYDGGGTAPQISKSR